MILRSRDEHLTVQLAKMAEQRNLSGNRPKYGAFAVLEPCAVKVASTVLRGGWASNGLSLPARQR